MSNHWLQKYLECPKGGLTKLTQPLPLEKNPTKTSNIYADKTDITCFVGFVTDPLVHFEKNIFFDLADVNQKLVNFQSRAKKSSTLGELYLVLEDFAVHDWKLLERASMSSEYTPTALKLIGRENANKYKTLEDLAMVCWRKRGVSDVISQTDINL